MRQETGHSFGERRCELQALTCDRVDEAEVLSMEGYPVEPLHQRGQLRTLDTGSGPAPIGVIPDDGVAQEGQVNPDLMGSTSLKPRLKVGEAREAIENHKAGDGSLSLADGTDRHPDPITRAATNWRLDDAGGPPERAVDDGDVAPRHVSRRKLSHQGLVRASMLGNHEEAGTAFVEAMDDPWTTRASHACH